MPETLVLIDGHALAYRMFFALSAERFRTRQGEPTNATYGFTRALVDLITAPEPPTYLAVSFDVGATFRDALFAEYKGTREKMPDELRSQIERIHEVLQAFSIPSLEVEGYEADDVLGTVARLAGEQGIRTQIITGDRDLLQLVDKHTTVQLPGKRLGEYELFDGAAVCEKYGIEPRQIVDYKALTGDTSDNIPGVRGIGEKTATSLLQTYGTVDAIYEHLDEIASTRFRNALEEGREDAFLSRELAQIVTDVPVELDLDACRTHAYRRENVADLFQELEFASLIRRLPGEADAPAPAGEGRQLPLFGGTDTAPASGGDAQPTTVSHIVTDLAALDALAETLQAAEAISFDTETTSTDQMRADLVGIALSVKAGEGYYIPVGHKVGDVPQVPLKTVVEKLRPTLTDPNIPKYGHNIKYDYIVMARHGLPVSPLSFDTMLAAWIDNPNASQGQLGLKAQAFTRLGVEMTEIEELIGKGKNQITMDLVPVERAAPYAACDADMTLRLAEQLQDSSVAHEQRALFYEVEMPLIPVLADMEQTGVLINSHLFEKMSAELSEELAGLMDEIHAIAGYEFNINSSQQLADVLFGTLQLPADGVRKTSTGRYSTAVDVLEGLRERDTTGVIEHIMRYRELDKLKSTYLDALPRMVNPHTGRIHTSYNQTGVVTGRISSSNPNLQNIPIRTEQGRRVRYAFISAPGHMLLGADYSQIELRVLAHISGDETLQRAFLEGQDIHASTAATVYGIPLDQVTREQRSFAKAVNFGLLYGMGAFRLARDSNLTLDEAENFIKAYFERYPKVRTYLDRTKEQAVQEGYVETLLKRRREFPIFQSAQRDQRTAIRWRAAEREAINMPIQGTAADIIKIAMIRLHKALHEQGLSGKMILQVHDELVLEVPEREADQTAVVVREVMENAYPMVVPLRVDLGIGPNWGELK